MGLEMDLLTLRALKGAPLSIVLAMMIANQPVGEGWLATATGYSQNTIRKGCKFLEETQIIGRNGRYEAYVLSDGAQLSLGMADENGERQNLTLPTAATTTFNKYEDGDSEVVVVITEERTANIDSRDDRLLILYGCGISEPTASRLIENSWCTEEYIRRHIEKARKEKISTGLLIHRIRSHDPMPKSDLERYQESWGIRGS